MKINLKVYGSLILIPILISLSWLLAGDLVKFIPSVELTIGRIGLSSIALFFMFLFSKNIDFNKLKLKTSDIKWWLGHIILTLTGRVFYFILSTQSLKTISPLQAMIFNGLLPIFSILFIRLSGEPFKNKLIPFYSTLSSIFAILSIFSLYEGPWKITIGLILMFFAILFFSLHLSLYKHFIKDETATETLFIQFTLCFFTLLPFNFNFIQPILKLDNIKIIEFLVYSLICNLAPFFLLHYCLKHLKSINIQLICTLTPIFGILMQFLTGNVLIPFKFIILTIFTILFISLSLYFDFIPSKEISNDK
jgi:drug/metabolite transporter (DMT)-like permease